MEVINEFDVAPCDVIGEHGSVGVLIVAKQGAPLPLETKYFRRNLTDPAVKFLVSKTLEVTVVEKGKAVVEKVDHNVEDRAASNNQLNVALESSPLVSKPGGDGSVGDVITNKAVDESDNDTTTEKKDEATGGVERTGGGKKFLGEAEFLGHLDSGFEIKVIGGLEVGMRKSVKEKLQTDQVLSGKENNAVINSLNLAVADQFGKTRPSAKLCAKLAEILKNKFPNSYRVQTAVQTCFGALALPRARGEGGNSDLVKRLGNCFYNQIVRPNIKRPVGTENMKSPVGGEKKKKVFGVSSEKWVTDEVASKEEKEDSVNSFKKLSEAVFVEEKKKLLKESRLFILEQFKKLEPSQSVEDLRGFWEGGPALLSEMFEWLTDGSQHGNLAHSAAEQLTKVLNIVEGYILSKKGEEYQGELQGVKDLAVETNGNELMYQIRLLRDLAKLFKNKAQKIIFIDALDDKKTGPEVQQPNIFVTKKKELGEAEFEEEIIINLNIGDKLVFKNLTLPEALASLIQTFFCFNILFPEDSDDIFEFVQRIACNYKTKEDGAKNKKGLLKKRFKDFEVFTLS